MMWAQRRIFLHKIVLVLCAAKFTFSNELEMSETRDSTNRILDDAGTEQRHKIYYYFEASNIVRL